MYYYFAYFISYFICYSYELTVKYRGSINPLNVVMYILGKREKIMQAAQYIVNEDEVGVFKQFTGFLPVCLQI